ncbi:ribbon-helix-helix domain-containing protein [Ponticaulis sp.]|uniref:ribbon-helix-helix domain-containing protein n=1 Tax=Ponticaulis sp. TaxID=2020902 RepID=UPI000C402140|nr:aryl-sulfate sulfotransferase [Ponticaulis sp.]
MNRSIRNVEISGRRTSFRLEEPFWDAVNDCAKELGLTVNQLITHAVRNYGGSDASMSSSLRVFLISHYRDRFLNRDNARSAA